MAKNRLTFLFLFSFVEGCALMATEIVSGKIISPFYGTSLYVWSSVLGVTMGGLALGYFFGGFLSEKYQIKFKQLSFLFILSAVLIWLMPFSAKIIMEFTLNIDIRIGILISCLFFMLLPIVIFGMISPLIIHLFSEQNQKSGFSAGLVYGVSTIGGIIFTFLTGFVFISTFGIKQTVNFISIYLLIPPVIYYLFSFFIKKK